MEEINDKQIILFDGVCNLCAGVVQFVIKRNTKENLLFASLQSDFGQKMLLKFNLPTTQFQSFIFLDKGILLQKSDAALTICTHLDSAWPMMRFLKIIPIQIRNYVYDVVAKNRFNWFGKKQECWLPDENLKKRFLVKL